MTHYRIHLMLVVTILLLGFVYLGHTLIQTPETETVTLSDRPASEAELSAVNALDLEKSNKITALQIPKIPEYLRKQAAATYPSVQAEEADGHPPAKGAPRTNSPPPPPPQNMTVYRVRKGDTLMLIAERVYGTASMATEIYQQNNDILISPDTLEVGTLLKLPARQNDFAPTISRKGVSYTVSQGDSLVSICARFYSGNTSAPYRRLVLLTNPGCIDATGNLRIGTSLFLPEAPDSLLPLFAENEQLKYRVKSGDTLTSISLRYYGTINEWKRIHNANLDVIPDPNALEMDTELIIPPLDSENSGEQPK